MKEKKHKITKLKQKIESIRKNSRGRRDVEEQEVKGLVRKIKELRNSIVYKEEFFGKINEEDQKLYGRKYLKTLFEDTMKLPYSRFKLFKRYLSLLNILDVY